MEIVGNVKTYDWGKLGRTSEVAKLANLNDTSFEPSCATTYSELWMGDHCSGPSTIKESGLDLGEFLAKDRANTIGGMDKLPFLFKVLSIRKALSVQVHPNKVQAEKLHAERPDIYKDPNHKPELAIALTPFMALCGFRPYAEISELIRNHKPLLDLIGADNVELLEKNDNKSEGLKTCFNKLMTSNEADVSECVQNLIDMFITSPTSDQISDVFFTLHKDFPNDVGCLCIFFLNILKMQPGEAIFLAANEPHAYLDGDCIECMACSDNVIRAGLTPKFRDVNTLIENLNYNAGPGESKLFQPIELDKCSQLFKPPVKDFAVVKVHVPKETESYEILNRPFGSILIVLSGSGSTKEDAEKAVSLQRGSIIFIPSSTASLSLQFKNADEDFIAYQAMFNDF